MSTQPLIIFDWDDTLFPTTALEENQDTNAEGSVRAIVSTALDQNQFLISMSDAQQAAIAAVQEALRHGKVTVITAATFDWIQFCIQYVPALIDLLAEHNIDVVSARDEYQHYTRSRSAWKSLAFRDEIVRMRPPSVRAIPSLISIGDGTPEHEAAKAVFAYKFVRNAHSIRLPSGPTFEQLQSSLYAVARELPRVCACHSLESDFTTVDLTRTSSATDSATILTVPSTTPTTQTTTVSTTLTPTQNSSTLSATATDTAATTAASPPPDTTLSNEHQTQITFPTLVVLSSLAAIIALALAIYFSS